MYHIKLRYAIENITIFTNKYYKIIIIITIYHIVT